VSGSNAVLSPGGRHQYLCVAEYIPGPSDDPRKLGFRKGDVMVLVQEVTQDWWEMRDGEGSVGLVPATFVEPASSAESAQPRKRLIAVDDYKGAGKKVSLQVGEIVTVISQTSNAWYQVAKADGTRGIAASSLLHEVPQQRFTAIADCSSDSPDRVSLVHGEVVTLVEGNSPEWVTVVKRDGVTTGLALRMNLKPYDPEGISGREVEVVKACRGEGQKLTCSVGQKLVLVHKLTTIWWEARVPTSGVVGYVPSHCVREAAVEPEHTLMRALAPFIATDRSQLTIELGDKVERVRELNNDWAMVRNARGEEGMVPRSFLQREDGAPSESMARLVADFRDPKTKTVLGRGELVTVFGGPTNGWCDIRTRAGRELQVRDRFLQEFRPEVVAIADYPGGPSQIAFTVNEVLALLAYKSADWMVARNTAGELGLVPSTYVRELGLAEMDHPPSSPTVPQRSASPSMQFPNLPPAYVRNMVPVDQWTNLHVLGWLQEQGPDMQRLMTVFSEEEFNGEEMLGLTVEDLADLGMANFGQRRSLHGKIQALRPKEAATKVGDLTMTRANAVAHILAAGPRQMPSMRPGHNPLEALGKRREGPTSGAAGSMMMARSDPRQLPNMLGGPAGVRGISQANLKHRAAAPGHAAGNAGVQQSFYQRPELKKVGRHY